MVIFIGILIFAAMIGLYACFGRRINENIGSGFGKEYMKDKWGMDEYIAVIDVKPYASDMECFVPLMEKFNLYTQRCRRDQK